MAAGSGNEWETLPLGPPLPLGEVIEEIVDAKTEIRQNLKNLILTGPTEHVGDQTFGVGLKNYLFEFPNSYGPLVSAIRQQVALWMPFVQIKDLTVEPDAEEQLVRIRLKYFIETLYQSDEVAMTEDQKDIFEQVKEYAFNNTSGDGHFVPEPNPFYT